MFKLFGRCFISSRRFLTTTNPCCYDLMTEIKVLRRKTGAGISLCVEALKQTDNNHDAAIKYIIDKSGAKMNNNASSDNEVRDSRDVKPGLVGIMLNAQNNFAVISKLNCQTDFVAKTEEFSKTFSEIMEMASRDIHRNYEFRPLEKVSFDFNDLKNTKHSSDQIHNELNTIDRKLNLLSTQVSEQLSIDNFIAITVPEKHYLGHYCHWTAPNVIGSAPFFFTFGRIGSLVVVCRDDLITPVSEEFIRSRVRELAIHVVGMLPTSLELTDFNALEASMAKDRSVRGNEDTDSDDNTDRYVGGALLDQPFFFRKSLNTRLWALRNKIEIVDFLLVE